MNSDPFNEPSQTSELEKENVLTNHAYDGIQEYDNPLPGWWTFLFWVSIIFAPLYVAYFHSGVDGRTIHEQYNQHMAQIFELRFQEIGELEPNRETLLKYLNDEPKWLAVGEVVYKTNCVGCHGADGSGSVGPNLTDDHWKNVRKIEDIARVIENGAANGSMPAWKNRLSHQNQIVLTAAYVASMRNDPKIGKPADGEIIPAWDE
ncbi:MAG: cbb3-type cytochrome c oxidase N-terminal domain-containing protein [Planctomycetota bacterium]